MKLLVVEDDPRISALLVKGLARAGHVADVAPTAAEARRLAADGSYDVILLDVMLPDGDGFDLCRTLREEGDPTPVLMLTARDGVEDKVGGLGAGADDYLTKPFAFEELVARLQALARRPRDTLRPAGPVRAGALELDPATGAARCAGVPVNLTPRLFAVLELLARNAGRVVDRDTLLARAWQTDFEPEANVVEAAVARLRAKLARCAGGRVRIGTVRGRGYRLEA
ncbi:MAG: response regulator transcription factor [Firmicutes bacterium]|nr:response regulator transcription factor [Bacillota bacterium]